MADPASYVWSRWGEPEGIGAAAQRGAQAALRGHTLTIQPCQHTGEHYYREDGLGPFCPSCGQIVWSGRTIKRHVQVQTNPIKRAVASLWNALCTTVLVVLAWSAIAADTLLAAVERLLDDEVLNWLVIIALAWVVSLNIVQLTLSVVGLHWAMYQVQHLVFTTAGTLLLAKWTLLSPRWSL